MPLTCDLAIVGAGGAIADGDRVFDWRQFAASAAPAGAVLVVGAGVVGLTLASQLAAAGRAVTLAEMRETVLDESDPDLAAAAAACLVDQGVDLLTATRVIATEPGDEGVVVRLLDIPSRTERVIGVAQVVITAGRRPDTRAIGLDTVSLETDRHGHVLTDANQETATPGLYAVGGAVPTLRTPTAARREACQAVEHATGRPGPPIRYDRLARRCDLRPEIAWVGLTERGARDSGRLACAAVDPPLGPLVQRAEAALRTSAP